MFKYKQLIVGVIIGASITTATGAYASVGDKLEAIVTQFNFVVNGKSVVIDTPIVTIADSSYLPVRTISNMLGYDVTYKADSRTIVLANGNTTTSQPTVTPTLPTTSPTPTNANNSDGQPAEMKEYFHGSGIHSAYKYNDTMYFTIGNGSEKYGLDKRDFVYNDLDKTITYKGKTYKVLSNFVIDCDAFTIDGVSYYKESIFSGS